MQSYDGCGAKLIYLGDISYSAALETSPDDTQQAE
jgi:hypothetical protein